MIKKDYDNKLEKLIKDYEDENNTSKEESLRLVIEFTKEYNIKYKNPYKHYFMGSPVKYSNNLVKALEKLLHNE
jgi:hypothetical protein